MFVQVNEEDAQKLVAAGVKIVAEGANMPSDPEAIQVYHAKVGSQRSMHLSTFSVHPNREPFGPNTG